MSKREVHERRRLAVIEAMWGDLEHHFPTPLGPCNICGDTALGQRHRVIDAIADRVRAGDPIGEVADDYAASIEAVAVALAVTEL